MEQEAEQSYEELSATIDRMAEVVKRIKELSAFGILGITSNSVHIDGRLFKKKFGHGRDVTRELKGSSIRCSIMYHGAEFCSWYDIPDGVIIRDGANIAKYMDLYEVELTK